MYHEGTNMHPLGTKVYLLKRYRPSMYHQGTNMHPLGPKVYHEVTNMHPLGTKVYHEVTNMHPLGTKVYLLKRYRPSDSIRTFFSSAIG